MKTIELTQGHVALVDDEDYELVSQHKWRAGRDPKNNRWYALCNVRLDGRCTTQSMQRTIMGLERGDPRQVDHKDREATLDNRRSNLRIATISQNGCNRGMRTNNISGFKGVRWHKHQKKWLARIKVSGTYLHLGYFDSPIEAAICYDAAALEHHGEFACTNAMLGLLKKPTASVERFEEQVAC